MSALREEAAYLHAVSREVVCTYLRPLRQGICIDGASQTERTHTNKAINAGCIN